MLEKKATRAARFVNDQYAELVQDHADRFRAFAALPMPHLQESLGEMRRALDQLRMTGVAMNTTARRTGSGTASVAGRASPFLRWTGR